MNRRIGIASILAALLVIIARTSSAQIPEAADRAFTMAAKYSAMQYYMTPNKEGWAGFGVTLEAGQMAEVSPGAAALHRRLARALARGFLVVFDYGHRAPVLYHAAARRHGTIAVHSLGSRRGEPLAAPGEVDLTAHVNWDDLIRAGEEEGLATREIARQGRFLVEAGLFDFVANDAEKWRAYRIVDPEGMGDQLSVLVQTRGI